MTPGESILGHPKSLQGLLTALPHFGKILICAVAHGYNVAEPLGLRVYFNMGQSDFCEL